MPSYIVHIITNLIILGLAYWIQFKNNLNYLPLDAFQIAVLIGIVIFYSILPDIDSPSSVSRKMVNVVGLSAIAYFAYLQERTIVIVIAAGLALLYMAKHRGLFHSFLIGLALAVGLAFYNFTWFIVALCAYNAHLILDGAWKAY